MKKTFQLSDGDKNKERVLEGIKHEIRKYIKREKRKTLPETSDYWDLKCKFGKNNEEPQVIRFIDITKNIDEAGQGDADSFYLEILSEAAKRKPREKNTDVEDDFDE